MTSVRRLRKARSARATSARAGRRGPAEGKGEGERRRPAPETRERDVDPSRRRRQRQGRRVAAGAARARVAAADPNLEAVQAATLGAERGHPHRDVRAARRSCEADRDIVVLPRQDDGIGRRRQRTPGRRDGRGRCAYRRAEVGEHRNRADHHREQPQLGDEAEPPQAPPVEPGEPEHAREHAGLDEDRAAVAGVDDRGERREGGDRAGNRGRPEERDGDQRERREASTGSFVLSEHEEREPADPEGRGSHVDEVGEGDERAEPARVEGMARQRRRSELEHGQSSDGVTQRGHRDGGQCRRGPDERDDCRRLRHAPEARRVGRRLEREQAEAPARDQHEARGDEGGLDAAPARLEQHPAAEGGTAREQDAHEKEQPQDDRGERRPSARRERGHGRRQAGADAEREHALDQVPVVRDHAPADGVGPAREPGAERDHERAVVSAEPPGRASEHRASRGVHGPVASRQAGSRRRRAAGRRPEG